jgi:hypothetical protein
MNSTKDSNNLLKKTLKWTAIIVVVYILYYIVNFALYITNSFPGTGTYDFIIGSTANKALRAKFISQLSLKDKLTTFSTSIAISDIKSSTFNGEEIGSCKLAGQQGNWHAGIWTASFAGEKNYYIFTCKDGFQQKPDSAYILTL